jgi:hypothetical protein
VLGAVTATLAAVLRAAIRAVTARTTADLEDRDNRFLRAV